MALKAILDSLEGLSEDVQKEYKQREDGKFVLDVLSVDGLELDDVSGLKNALGQERAKAKKFADQLKGFEGIDPTKAKNALSKIEEMTNWTPEEKVQEQIKAREAQLIEQHNKDKEGMQSELQSVSKSLEEVLITNAALQAIDSAKGSATLLLPHIQKSTRMRKTEDNKYIAEVVDANGNPRIGDSSGNPMTIPQFVEELKGKEDFALAFKGSEQTGTGAGDGSSTPSTPQTPGTVLKISRSDQNAINQNMEKIANGEAVIVD